ncbi:MAG: hypothetical protein U1E26_05065 [Coriobacteriia bacterium]|nr:hypothetical protein [Coriobacteriia bacterium]
MGRNAEIKRFNGARSGQPLELFDGGRISKLPIIVELLASPWILSASDLVRRDGSVAPKRVAEDIVVEWDTGRGCPLAFIRGTRRFGVDAVLQVWSSERAWWDPRRHVSRRYWRVLARGGVYDLVFDRSENTWQLIGIQD